MVSVVGDASFIVTHEGSDAVACDSEIVPASSWIATACENNDRLADVHTNIVPQCGHIRLVRDERARAVVAATPDWSHGKPFSRQVNAAVGAVNRKARLFDLPIFETSFPADLQEEAW